MKALPRAPHAGAALLLTLTAAVLTAPAARAQSDVSGDWTMDSDATMPGEASPCVFSGDCTMDQDGGDVTGQVSLHLVSGPESCPPMMAADLDGSIDGKDVVMGAVMDGDFGTAEFVGERSNSFDGTFEVTSGPFEGTAGTWIAERQTVLEIPTLRAAGLAALALLLLTAGGLLLSHRRRHAAG